MEVLRKLGSYLNFFRRQDAPTENGASFNLRAMHTINKISIFMFIVCMVIVLIKFVILR